MIAQQDGCQSSDEDNSRCAIEDTQVRGGQGTEEEENDNTKKLTSSGRTQDQSASTLTHVQDARKRPRSNSLDKNNVSDEIESTTGTNESQRDHKKVDDRIRNNKKTSYINTAALPTNNADAALSREGTSGENPPESILQHRWDNMFERLVHFKEKHGHCLVPNRYDADKSLGAWVSTQRRHYKTMNSGKNDVTTPLTAERAQRLQDIGFVWATSDPRHTPWEVRFGQLREYQEKFGNCLVPIGYKDNVKLANWVSTQRQEFKAFKEGRQTRMTSERIQLLNSIEMIWDAQRGGNRHRGRYRPMSEYSSSVETDMNNDDEEDGKIAAESANHGRFPLAMRQRCSTSVATLAGNPGATLGLKNEDRQEASTSSTASGFALDDALADSSVNQLRSSTTSPLRHDLAAAAFATRGNRALSQGGAIPSLWPTGAGLLAQRMPSSLHQVRLDSIAGSPASAAILAAHLNRSNAFTMATARIGGDRNGLMAGAMLNRSESGSTDALAAMLLQQTSALAASASFASSANHHLFTEQLLANNASNPLASAGLSSLLGNSQPSILSQYPFAGRLPQDMGAARPATFLSNILQQQSTNGMGLGTDSGILNYQAGLGPGTTQQSPIISSSLQLLLAANNNLGGLVGGGNISTAATRRTSYGIPLNTPPTITTPITAESVTSSTARVHRQLLRSEQQRQLLNTAEHARLAALEENASRNLANAKKRKYD